MAESIRKLIFKNLEETLREDTPLLSVRFGTFDPNKALRPNGAIIPNDDVPEEETDDIEPDNLSVVIRTVVDEDDEKAGYELEDLLAAVEKAVMADPTRGGLAENTRRTRTHWLFLDENHPQAGADTEYEIFYLRKQSDPAVGA